MKTLKVGEVIKGSNGKLYVVVLHKDRYNNIICDRCCFYKNKYGCTNEYRKVFNTKLDCTRLMPDNTTFMELDGGI